MTEKENELHHTLGRIEGKLDGLTATVDRSVAIADTLRDDHEAHKEETRKEISGLKARINYLSGAFAAVMTIVVFFKDKILGLFP